jgi:tRNA pseudouridine38-40 synthase
MNELVDPVNELIRFKADFAYDGTDFNGWAKQPGYRTVEGELLEALEVIFGESDNSFGLTVAGRTDSGVHARHQVVHFDLNPTQIKRLGRFGSPGILEGSIRDRINSLVKNDIRVFSVVYAPEGFEARFSAIYRRYRYRIADGLAVKDPVESRNTLWTRRPLDLLEMQATALSLYGLHDFAAFCKPRPFATTIRELREVTIERRPDENHVVVIELTADAFCHNMVRSIVGALIAVGEGRATRQDVLQRLNSGNRKGAYKVVSSRGLTLLEIGYPEDSKLAEQANLARDHRKLADPDDLDD